MKINNLIEQVAELENAIFSDAWSAKMLEDTFKYDYNHLIVINDCGDILIDPVQEESLCETINPVQSVQEGLLCETINPVQSVQEGLLDQKESQIKELQKKIEEMSNQLTAEKEKPRPLFLDRGFVVRTADFTLSTAALL